MKLLLTAYLHTSTAVAVATATAGDEDGDGWEDGAEFGVVVGVGVKKRGLVRP